MALIRPVLRAVEDVRYRTRVRPTWLLSAALSVEQDALAAVSS
jgi:hypothetical protein